MKLSRSHWFLSAVCLLSFIPLFAINPLTLFERRESAANSSNQKSATGSNAVLVELFTSEGCSSCPPADKLLTELEQSQPVAGATVIALSEHVDYWNRMGWKDPFSSADFSRRQVDYAKSLGIEDYYTPQMIVDGRTELVGSKRSAALEAVGKAALAQKAAITAELKDGASNSISLSVQAENVPEVSHGDKADVMLALAESGLRSKVSKGENSGRELAHSSVARKLVKIGTVDGKSFRGEQALRLDSAWKRENTKAVVFIQERSSHRILGATAINL
jgi:hypothetical protein